jgi:K+-sensing histidine kinase KdpD
MGPLLGVPILFKGLSIGNIYLARSAGGEEFSEQDQQIISLLSSQVGVILENFRLNSVLQRAITARDNTLAIVSHDLKSPLSSITLGAQVLQRKTSNNPEFEFLNRTLQNMNNSTSIMKALISDLLDAAAIESGKIQINLDIFPIADLLENLRGQFQQLSESKKIKLEVQYPKDEIKFSVTLLGSSRC